MENSKKGSVGLIILVVLLAIVAYFVFASPKGGSILPSFNSNPPPELAPALQMTSQEKTGDVSAKRAEILSLANSGKPLTNAQKGEISGILLTKANLYKFNDAERQAIFSALNR